MHYLLIEIVAYDIMIYSLICYYKFSENVVVFFYIEFLLYLYLIRIELNDIDIFFICLYIINKKHIRTLPNSQNIEISDISKISKRIKNS